MRSAGATRGADGADRRARSYPRPGNQRRRPCEQVGEHHVPAVVGVEHERRASAVRLVVVEEDLAGQRRDDRRTGIRGDVVALVRVTDAPGAEARAAAAERVAALDGEDAAVDDDGLGAGVGGAGVGATARRRRGLERTVSRRMRAGSARSPLPASTAARTEYLPRFRRGSRTRATRPTRTRRTRRCRVRPRRGSIVIRTRAVRAWRRRTSTSRLVREPTTTRRWASLSTRTRGRPGRRRSALPYSAPPASRARPRRLARLGQHPPAPSAEAEGARVLRRREVPIRETMMPRGGGAITLLVGK